MNISNLESYGQILAIREHQIKMTSSNIANQDTPNYKAKNIDFKETLNKIEKKSYVDMAVNQKGHIRGDNTIGKFSPKYIITGSMGADNNSVNEHYEKMKFAEYDAQYQAALSFSSSSRSSLINILKDK